MEWYKGETPHKRANTWALGQYWIFRWNLQPPLLKLVHKTGKYASSRIRECPLPRKLLGAWCSIGNCLRGGQLKTTRHVCLNLLNNLKFDESDPILGSNDGELSCIMALITLITGNNVEFKLRADHGIHELVRDWILDSTQASESICFILIVKICPHNKYYQYQF